MICPDTHYAKSAGGYVAWQVFGEQPRDILFVPSWGWNIDAMWDEPICAHYLRRLLAMAGNAWFRPLRDAEGGFRAGTGRFLSAASGMSWAGAARGFAR